MSERRRAEQRRKLEATDRPTFELATSRPTFHGNDFFSNLVFIHLRIIMASVHILRSKPSSASLVQCYVRFGR